MKRKIKFRAWDKEDKKIREVTCINWFDEYVECDEKPNGYCTRRRFTEFVLMQFTGLKDKNGKEIWEGDILRTNVESVNGLPLAQFIYRVEFSNGCFGVVEGKNQLNTDNFNNIDIEEEKLEVIGNVWENPDLLTPKS
jgi:uncharacterized phage protein (TIGR01671 family)